MSRDSNPGRRASRRTARSVFRLAVVLLSAAVALPGFAQTENGYRLPPQVLVDLVDRPMTPQVRLSGDSQWLLLLEQPTLPSIAELAEPELRLGGLRFKPDNYGPSRRWTLRGMELRNVASGESRQVQGLPEPARLDHFTFSPDSRHVAFTQTRGDAIELWVADVETAEARRLVERPLNLNARLSPRWLSDSKTLVAAFRVEDAGEPPAAPTVPTGPVIQENLGSKAPARTYQDLLKNGYDEAVYSYFMTAQLATVAALDGSLTPLGEPGLLSSYSPSPDGRYLLVETLHKPFSYLVPARRFPKRVEVLDLTNKQVHLIVDLPLHENVPVPFGSVPTGPRSFGWRADADATLIWAEALDGGDAGREAELRDELFFLAPPFTGEPTPWMKLELRFGGVTWGTGELALVREWWWKTRRERVSRVAPDDPEAPAKLLVDRSFEDRYNDPGNPVTRADARGQRLLRTADGGKTIYRIGSGASPEGDRPFLDAYDLETGESRRLFHSTAPYYERPVLFIDEEGRTVLTRRESVDEPPNYFVRDLKDAATLRQLTDFPHPTPELAGIQKELVKYERDDGVQLTATLYLPPGYKAEDGALPTLVWAYPKEFKNADAAGQVRDSPYRFDRVGWWSPLLWLTQGYAVLDDPAMPIVGEGDEEPNDTFREQLVASAKAGVEECIRRGVGEAGRFAIAGHSYGAFMTANLLAHSDLFAAGIARSGAYNRTLTPFGFQAEERTLWEAPEVYFKMSPFMHAEKVNEPILLIHGAADNNSGTFPMQSERYYNALKGHGATARLVMLPHESHGYRARESVLHMLWETHAWLERYVKNPEEVPEVERGTDHRGSP